MIFTTGNAKGGVGKSTVAINLSAALATNADKYRVCAVDFDFQSNLTNTLIKKGVEIKQCMYDILGGANPDIEDCIYPTVHPRLDLIPSVVELSGLEIGLYADYPKSSLIFRNFAREYLLKNYTFVICDVGPSLNIFLNQALCASDGVFIVADVGSAFSMVNVKTMFNHILSLKGANPDLLHTKMIMNKINRSRLVDKKNIDEIKDTYGDDEYYDTILPVSADFREVERLSHSSIFKYKPRSKGAQAFRELSREIINEFF